MTSETHTNTAYHARDLQHYLQTFKRYPITFSHGKGAYLWDVEGTRYLDALGGIAVNSLGHAHPALVSAIQEQAARVIHVSNFYLTQPQVEVSEKLTQLSGLERVFMTNSGAESVEGAIKIARKYAHSKGKGGTIVSFEGSFHGRTLATIATGKKKLQQGFEPIPHGFGQIPFNDIDAATRIAGPDVAAFIIEPVQGEGGINVADRDFLLSLRALCDENDIVLIFDEIQCGMGRTGHWFAKDHFNVEPDIMTLAKALGGGMPVGAVLSSEKVSQAIEFGDHGTTFGGNPMACAAALAVIRTIEEENLLEHVRDRGRWLRDQLGSMDTTVVREVRGLGLMIGAVLDFEAKLLVDEMLRAGVLANATAGNVLRLLPPLNIQQKELEQVVAAIRQGITEIAQNA